MSTPNLDHRPIRIAIVDDHPIYTDGLTKLLALEDDLEVVAQGRDGRSALDIVPRLEPDILLLDLKMPKMDGITTLKALRRLGTYRTKVIVITASDDKREMLEALRLGACGVVLVQTTTELLIKSIRRVHAEGTLHAPDEDAGISSLLESLDDSLEAGAQSPREHVSPQMNEREREITSLISQGLKNKEIVERLGIDEQQVKNHLHNIFDKLGVSDRLELALYSFGSDHEILDRIDSDNRTKRRFLIEREVRYRVIGETQIGVGMTRNISSGGVMFTTEMTLAMGTPLEVSMNWPVLFNGSIPMEIRMYGCVNRSNDNAVALGIERYTFEKQ